MLRFFAPGSLPSLALVLLSVLLRIDAALAQHPENSDPTEAVQSGPEGDDDRCLWSHREGQKLERKGQLLAAGRAYQECLLPHCSPVLREECGARLLSVESDTPTIIVAVQHGGKDLVDGAVYDGDERVSEGLSGVAMPLDPGPHHLRVVAPGFVPGVQSIVARVGEKNRVVVIVLEPKEEGDVSHPVSSTSVEPSAQVVAPRNRQPQRSIWGPFEYGLFSAGAALGVGGAVLGILALTDYQDARTECSPFCSDERMNSIRAKAYTADALFALSAVAVVTGSIRLTIAKRQKNKSAALVLTPRLLAVESSF